MTEDEAKTKFCPLIVPAAAVSGADRGADWPSVPDAPAASCKCIASSCMMWDGEDCGLMHRVVIPADQPGTKR